MSADNLVQAIPFRKMTGEVVWRVAELQLSGLPWDLVHMMSTQARLKTFLEFEGLDAAKQAHAAALRVARSLPVCEYGVSCADESTEPYTMAKLQQEAVEQGYNAEAVYSLREATDEDFGRMEVAYWAEH